jgi:hypothetical protein
VTVKNQEAVNAIAAAFTTGFTNPGSDQRQAANLYLPGLDPRGKPTHIAEAIKAALQSISEAIVYVIEQKLDSTIIPNSELKELRARE